MVCDICKSEEHNREFCNKRYKCEVCGKEGNSPNCEFLGIGLRRGKQICSTCYNAKARREAREAGKTRLKAEAFVYVQKGEKTETKCGKNWEKVTWIML